MILGPCPRRPWINGKDSRHIGWYLVNKIEVKSKGELHLLPYGGQKAGMSLFVGGKHHLRGESCIFYSSSKHLPSMNKRHVRAVFVVRLYSPQVLNTIKRVKVKNHTFGINVPIVDKDQV